jgi:hypothetical protein
VLNLTLSGGEPLAHPDFFLLGSRARELGFVVRVKSNGHALRGAALRRLRDKVGSCAGSSPPGKSRTPTPREALLLSEPVLVETASVLSSGSTRPAAYPTDRVSAMRLAPPLLPVYRRESDEKRRISRR